jgi:hypothetical protein
MRIRTGRAGHQKKRKRKGKELHLPKARIPQPGDAMVRDMGLTNGRLGWGLST